MKHIILDIENDILYNSLIHSIIEVYQHKNIIKQNINIFDNPLLINQQTELIKNFKQLEKSIPYFDVVIWNKSHLSLYNIISNMPNFNMLKHKLIYEYEMYMKFPNVTYLVSDNILEQSLTSSKISNVLIKHDNTLTIQDCYDFLNIELNVEDDIVKESKWIVTGL